MTKLRVAAPSKVSYRPLTQSLSQGLGADRLGFAYLDESACVEGLRTGSLDLALVPISTLREVPDLRVMPDLGIVSRGASGEWVLGAPSPWQVMDGIALPQQEADAVALLQILCHARGLPFAPTPPHPAGGMSTLGIDPGREFFHVHPCRHDLVAAWEETTGLPFVHAVWMGRPHAGLDETIHAILRQSAREGVPQARRIAAAHAEVSGADKADVEDRLLRRLRFFLDARGLSGAATYLDRLAALEPAHPAPPLRFFEFAYRPETPAMVPWPAPPPAAGAPSVDTLLADAARGARLSPSDAIRLYAEAPLADLGAAADQRRRQLHPGDVVTYIIDRNVNYTSFCVTACKFCNFYRPMKSREGYTLTWEQLAEKFEETVAMEGIQILLQGGVNPNLPLRYYEDLFRRIKSNFPLALHALSPEEIRVLAELEHLSVSTVLERLMAAGLDSLPGAGAEILDDEIRHAISPLKCSTDTWLSVMRDAHALGMRTTATLVFGFGENAGHIVRHLERLRALQDRTSGFTAFICWPFQAEGTRLRLRDDTSPARYLRLLALARLYLDNFPNLQVSWPTLGPAIGQIGLRFGGNDFGSAMIEENVVSQAGAVFKLSAAEIERQIRAAGFTPRRRNMRYEHLSRRNRPAPTPVAEVAIR